MSNTADVTGGKPIAVWSHSILGLNSINPLVLFYDIHGRKREVLFLYFVPDTTRDIMYVLIIQTTHLAPIQTYTQMLTRGSNPRHLHNWLVGPLRHKRQIGVAKFILTVIMSYTSFWWSVTRVALTVQYTPPDLPTHGENRSTWTRGGIDANSSSEINQSFIVGSSSRQSHFRHYTSLLFLSINNNLRQS
jgi:hypothetical protein